MSYIKRLQLKGFKSFANPTVIKFEKGFNTVVGANGSGKSNVFDALCFVLGRMSSKGLRADKLGNLVFNGGKNLKPAKEAEVSIYLSNEQRELLDVELDEIKITRIVKNTGQSQYFLNNKKVTRTEVVEVLKRGHINPDGYNIILQGDIMRIVNMSPIERRELIEEISDISGYEEQRQKSLKKLEKVELDLKEADLLMEEKTKYIRELKSEKEQAERFEKVKSSLRFNSLLLVKSKIIRNTNLKAKKLEDKEKAEAELAKYREKLDEFEQKSSKIDEQISGIEKEIEIKSHNDFISVTNKITSLEGELKNLKEKRSEFKKSADEMKIKISALKADISNNKKSVASFEKEIGVLEKEKKKLEAELAKFEQKLSSMKKSVGSGNFEEIEKIEAEIDELNLKKEEKLCIRQDNAIQIEKLNTKIEHLETDLKRIEGEKVKNKDEVKKLESLRSKLKKLILEISSKVNKNSEISAKLSRLTAEYNEFLEKEAKMRMKVESSKELMATNRAVDAILKLKANDSQIRGTVAELGSVSDKYSLALETISGRSLFNIVVSDDKVAVKYINYLKDKKIGNATFLPLNKINAKYKLDDSVLNKKGVIDYALNLIKYDREYENVFHLIFGDTLVIDSIESAKHIGIGKYKMVSLDGDVALKSGAMSGGFKSRKKGLGAFRDDNLTSKLEEIESRVMALRSSVDHLRCEKEESEREIYELRSQRQEIEGELATLEKVLSIEGRDTSQIQSEIEAIVSDKAVIEGSLKKIDKDIDSISRQIESLAKEKVKLKEKTLGNLAIDDLSRVEEKRDDVKNKILEINSKIDSKKIQVESVLKPEIVNLEKILKETEESLVNLNKTLGEIKVEISEKEGLLKEFKLKEKELSKDYKQFIEKRDKLKEEKKKLEVKYEKEFSKFDKIKEKVAQLSYAIGEFETLNKNLEEELEIQYNSIKAEFISTYEDESEAMGKVKELVEEVDETLKSRSIDVKELQNRVNNLKTKMNAFGSINMKAVEIYDKLKDEFDALLEKRETLNSDKSEILSFVAEMDEKKRVRFMETFEKLRENFVSTFSKLSTKGEAELNIENEKDLFNSGVEIKVRLSKKNYLDIKSLSGGEKTITAVAFIFAVQEFSPASFYIFDEIDAALDIMNCEKLGKLVKNSAHKAQYIVVSHSEYFIQSSDTIFGVTMDANKISGVVSLDLSSMKEYVDTEASES